MEPRIKVGDNGGPERMVNRERAGGGRKLRRGEGERSGKGWKEEKLVTERGKKRREREWGRVGRIKGEEKWEEFLPRGIDPRNFLPLSPSNDRRWPCIQRGCTGETSGGG